MILDLLGWTLLSSAVAWGAEAPEADPEPGAASGEESTDLLAPWRVPLDVLSGRTIGSTSQAVAFDWRRGGPQIALSGGYVAELNSFNSMRAGALMRLPMGGTLLEIGVSRAETWDSESSRLLAFTPYRQPARPSRFEVDFGVALPLAEGVVTSVPRFFPATQLVFHAYGGIRYLAYPQGFGEMRLGQIFRAALSPSLTEHELERLEGARLDAMQLDPGRFGLMAGFGNDIYFKSGFFVSPRVLIAIPLLAPASQTELLIWADFSLALGWAF